LTFSIILQVTDVLPVRTRVGTAKPWSTKYGWGRHGNEREPKVQGDI